MSDDSFLELQHVYKTAGGETAPDGIPRHFGDLDREYTAALENVVIMDRSHQGRIEVRGRDRVALLDRMSTNTLIGLQAGEGRATVFTNPTGRILDRAVVLNWSDDALLLLAGPGRGAALAQYLGKHIFYNDHVTLALLDSQMHQFDLHGPKADAVVQQFVQDASRIPAISVVTAPAGDSDVHFVRMMHPLSGSHWCLLFPRQHAVRIWRLLTDSAAACSPVPAGSLTYNTLRIRAGQPGAGRELTSEYIPLEVGLWDEVSFNKGCYTGQEIIARMDSRQQLARTIVSIRLSAYVEAPADLFHEGRRAGMLTSSVVSPRGEIFGIAVIKTTLARPGQALSAGSVEAIVGNLLGAQPGWIVAQHENTV